MSDDACSGRSRSVIGTIALAATLTAAIAGEGTPMEPFQPDEHTLLLYHLDEGQGDVVHDAGRFGYHGQMRGDAFVPPADHSERQVAAQETFATARRTLPKAVPPLLAPVHAPWTQPLSPRRIRSSHPQCHRP